MNYWEVSEREGATPPSTCLPPIENRVVMVLVARESRGLIIGAGTFGPCNLLILQARFQEITLSRSWYTSALCRQPYRDVVVFNFYMSLFRPFNRSFKFLRRGYGQFLALKHAR